MLKLLEQAQINSPLEQQNTIRTKNNFDNNLSNTYNIKTQRQVSKFENFLFGEPSI